MSNYKNQSYVIDRHGQRVNVQFDRITSRIQTLCNDEYYGTSLDVIDPIKITQNVVMKFSSGISTKELDQLAIDDCTEHISHNEQYDFLAARLAITGFIHKETSPCIKEATNALVTDGYDEFSDEYVQIVNKYYDQINHVIDHKRDFKFKYFGYKTILKYLKKSKKFIERPQHAYMRVAISLFCGTPDQKGHLNDDLTEQLEQAFEFYDGLSRHYYSCASPIVLNGGTKVQQLSSCFLLPTGDDLSTLMDTHKDCAMISKWAGGIGVWLSSIRAEGAKIGSNGTASGIKHYVKMMNELQLYVNQRGLRPGAFAMYLEPWHADIYTFLEVLPRTHNITFNASDLKYALWIPDNFMRALSSPNGSYYLFSPDECPGLYNTHGQEFEDNYNKYVEKGLAGQLRTFREVKALEIFKAFYETVTQVGTPYVGFKDTVNKLSNMKNVATICSSNLCIEISIPSWTAHDAELFGQPEKESEYGCCNLGAICLPSFVRDGKVDYLGIIENTKKVVRALDNVIDLNYYPAEPAKRSNFRHRPIGIGVMGLADVFQELRVVFGSPEARAIDQAISACIYYGAMLESTNIAEVKGSYPSYTFKNGAPALHGILQPDMHVQSGYLKPNWEQLLNETTEGVLTSNDWVMLRSRTSSGLLRNSYVTAYMPTASTANIVGCNEASEPYTSNIYKRSSNTGEFMITNKYLIRELESLGIWNDRTRKSIMLKRGSVQHLNIPEHVKKMFKTSWEIDQRAIIVHAQARGVFICQMQSMNLFHKELTMQNLLTYIMLGWKLGLKSGCYYNHTQAVDTTVQSALLEDEVTEEEAAILVCRRDNPNCAACSV